MEDLPSGKKKSSGRRGKSRKALEGPVLKKDLPLVWGGARKGSWKEKNKGRISDKRKGASLRELFHKSTFLKERLKREGIAVGLLWEEGRHTAN